MAGWNFEMIAVPTDFCHIPDSADHSAMYEIKKRKYINLICIRIEYVHIDNLGSKQV